MNSCNQESAHSDSEALLLGLPFIPTPRTKPGRLWLGLLRSCCKAILFQRRLKKIITYNEVSSETRTSYVASASSSELRSPSLKYRRSSSAGPHPYEGTELVDRRDPEHHNLRILSAKSSFHCIDVAEEEPGEQQHPTSSVVEQDLRSIVERIMREKDQHNLEEFGGVAKVASVLGSDLTAGLMVDEDPRTWDALKPSFYATEVFKFFLEACNNLNVLLLLVSFILSILIENFEKNPIYMWHDSMAIIFAVFLLVVVPMSRNLYDEIKSRRRQGQEKKLQVSVTRRGDLILVSVSEIKEGELVHLKKNDFIPADGLFIEGNELMLDEVLHRRVDKKNSFLLFGSKVIEGSCSMLVTSVRDTTLEEMLNNVNNDSENENLLNVRIDNLNDYIQVLSLVFSVLIMVVLLIRLVIKKYDIGVGSLEKPELKGDIPMAKLMKMFADIVFKPHGRSTIVCIMTVVVLEFQHALPLVIAKILCFWRKKLELGDAKLGNLSACCTMGLVTTVIINTTGGQIFEPTETEVKKVWIGKQDMTDSLVSGTSTVSIDALQRVVELSALVPEIFGDPESDKLISRAKEKWGENERSLTFIGYKYLGSQKAGGGVLVKKNGEPGGPFHLHWRGAASAILRMCSHYYDCDGSMHTMENCRRMFEEYIKDMEDSGLHPMALAYRRLEIKELEENDLILLALVGVKFSCEETKSAVTKLRNANVSIKFISDDGHSACEDLLDESVIKCSSSVDKIRLIQDLQQRGHIVGYYGGFSANDILPLRTADLCIVPSIWATEAARKMSDIVILRKNIGALIPIIESGRCVYHNIQIFFQLQLISSISGLLLTLTATMLFGDSPISTIELILSNFVINLSGGLLMAMEVKRSEQSTGQQAKRTESLVTKAMLIKITMHVCCQVSVLLVVQLEGQVRLNVDERVVKVMIFNSFFMFQIFNHLAAMKLMKKELVHIFHYKFLLSIGAIFAMQVLVVLFAEKLIYGITLNGRQQLICILVATVPWGFIITFKLMKSAVTSMPLTRNGSYHLQALGARPFARALYWFVPFFMIIYTSYHFKAEISTPFR